ncbi:alpha-glucosidase [Aestuariicella hydrocarbonica]|uniref:Alpha-glucosidase n=1 Tax=Pseudomaricurvus hydrocarbonicus TaxID=1470433 RepID=A0A9E5MNP7_9GAMM|nr:alpha-glucosidase family protein [Aestuariicella hydrocarbonica]NHO67644.1 alpha-glucosidase [Aestuariicella hydrocarbonica]
MSKPLWWQGAVIYQIYPRSLNDTNGDGIGDIPGIIEKMDYIASLGVDAIWVSPFFKSPMKDFGYDISDYRDIDPQFGTLDDFDTLIETAHRANIKVIIDQVISHTSDQHDWFLQSRQSRDNDKADWYVWADPQADGTPPNNWMSLFGGVAWEWEPRREQYYLHNFLSSQPDLNFHNPAVRQQILDEVEFWLQRGVDGLRLDAINFCFHDQQLRNNPAKPPEKRQGRGFSEDNPYAFQYHYYNNTRPENLGFLEDLRALLNRYPGTVSLGEISAEDSLATMAEYTQGDKRLHTAYSFELLVDDFSADYIRSTVSTLEQRIQGGWPCWAVGNHDVARVMSRWGGPNPSADLAKMVNAMLGSLKGSLCSYQGEELGLPEADIPFEQLQDPYGITFWPNFKGRDGCRTPIPWNPSGAEAGFSTGTPWLPITDAHRNLSVEQQDRDPGSVLNHYRQFMHWRREQPALRWGDIEFLDAPDNVLLFIRRHQQQTLLVAFNLNDHACQLALPEGIDALCGHGIEGAELAQTTLRLPAHGAFYGQGANL